MNRSISQALEERFKQLFNEKPVVVRSPGRVNIIGEHTDYNQGFVLPAAIDKAIYLAISPRNDMKVQLYSAGFRDSFTASLDQLAPVPQTWPNYILGVADQLIRQHYRIRGFNLVVDGDVPIGSGLSSSAALECATAFALDHIYDLGIQRREMAFMAQQAEHSFAGVQCGIMDQFASLFGKKDRVIRLDCRSLDYEYLPLKLDGLSIVLLNTNVKHSLASSEYNARRQECGRGVDLVRTKYPEVSSLRDVTIQMLEETVLPVDQMIFKRCRYVVEENSRLIAACTDLKNGNIDALGQKMHLSHQGLSREYEVSCPELDFLVQLVKDNPDVKGARMMGGGFGGCTINLVKDDKVEELIAGAGKAYKDRMNRELTAYVAQIDDGTSLVSG